MENDLTLCINFVESCELLHEGNSTPGNNFFFLMYARGDADVGYGLFQAVLGIGSLNNAVKSATLPL